MKARIGVLYKSTINGPSNINFTRPKAIMTSCVNGKCRIKWRNGNEWDECGPYGLDWFEGFLDRQYYVEISKSQDFNSLYEKLL